MMSNVPKLRFKEFSGEWEEKKLTDMIDFKSGYAFSSSQMSNDIQKYQLIKMSNIYQNVLSLDRSPSYWKDLNNAQKDFLLEKGDVVLTLTGTVGKRDYGYSAVITENNKFLLNQRLVRLRAKKDKSLSTFVHNIVLNERFLYHFFANSKGGTGNQSNVSIEDIKQIKLPLPSKQEQEKIASFLTSVDTKIQQLTKKEELLSSYKKGVMQKIFSGEIRFKADDGSEFAPWEEKRLGDVVNFENGKAHEKNIVENGDYIVVNSKFISSDGKVLKYSDIQITPLYKNDIVMVMSDVPNGKALAKCYVVKEDGKCTLNQRICALHQKDNNNQFLYYIINRNRYYLAFDSGVGQTNLRKDEVLALSLSVPSLEEQTKIANFLSSIDSKIEQIQKQLVSTKEFKKALLQQMFV